MDIIFFCIVPLALIGIVITMSRKVSDKKLAELSGGVLQPNIPQKLLALKTTSVAERQRVYHRSFNEQLRYDVLQMQAEALNDTATLEAIRTNTYEGNMPIKGPDKYTHYTSEVYEFDIAGMMYRDLKKVEKCEGVGYARLVAEPTNEFDPDAIKVIHESNTHVGYISRDMTATVRKIVTLPANCFVHITCDTENDYAQGTVYIEILK